VAVRTRYDGETTRPTTAADFSHDGKVLFVKNWNEVMAWPRNANQSIFQALAQNRETDCVYNGPGSEAITVGADASALYSITEGNTPNITRVNVTLPDPGLTCDGVMANIKGTGAGETLTGTARRDVMHGRGGSDTIQGRGGPDLICGGAGADTLYGNGAGDRLLGGSGADDVRGGPGADSLFGNDGPDLLYGQNGGDSLRGNAGTDELRGGSGFDTLNGGPGSDVCGVGGGTGTKTNC
jgi:Ca2+-binding RTX toxin-like protein